MRRLFVALAGLGLIGATLIPGSLSASGPVAPVDDYVLVPTATPTPKTNVLLGIPNQRGATPTPVVKLKTP